MVCGLILLALLLRLGVWQLDRAAQKTARYQQFQQRYTQAPVALDTLSNATPEQSYWRAVTVAGHYQPLTLLLDNRVHDGEVGYEVLAPFALTSGQLVLVDRGWLAAPGDRASLPAIETPTAAQTLNGRIGPPPVHGISLGSAASAREQLGPALYRLQEVELPTLETFFRFKLLPYVVYLDASDSSGYRRDWPIPGNDAAKHMAYAVQWFAMAAVLVLIFVVIKLRRRGSH